MAGQWDCATLDVGYVSRVIIKRDSSTEDYRWKQSAELAPSAIASPLVDKADDNAVLAAFQAEPDIDQLDAYPKAGNTLSLLILRNGNLIHSWYGNGHARGMPAAAFSISKSIIALIAARTVASGDIKSLSIPITEYLPDLLGVDQRFERITMEDLIDMRSGVGFSNKVSFSADKSGCSRYIVCK